jgi:hypothetical protein
MSSSRSISTPLVARMSRRRALRALGLGARSLPLITLSACGDDGGGDGGERGGGGDVDAGGGLDGATGDAAADAVTPGGWAMGGTAVMTGDYPDPFTGGVTACALTCETTLVPATPRHASARTSARATAACPCASRS